MIRYRRGKSQSNDVDVVFCPRNEGDDRGLLRDLYRRLTSMGIVTHILRTSLEFESNADLDPNLSDFPIRYVLIC
jgi:DNA polymerase mu